MTSSEEALFFAGSDDEGDVEMDISEAQAPESEGHGRSSIRASPVPQTGLFFADSDDEDISIVPNEDSGHKIIDENVTSIEAESANILGDWDMPFLDESEPPKSSSVAGTSPLTSPTSSPPLLSAQTDRHIAKKRRLSFSNVSPPFTTAYIGSFIIGNAWSTVKGKGYVMPGDKICIERDDPEVSSTTFTKASSSKTSKKGPSKEKDKKKQLSIATLLKAQPPKPKKKGSDTVVRLANIRGFEFGRLPQEVASWVSKLLDMGIVDFRGSTMVDCPMTLHSGADLIVSLSVYIRASAFKAPSSSSGEQPEVTFNNGQESLDEQSLRERKSALLRLFDAVSLKPRRGSEFLRDRKGVESALNGSDLKKMTQHSVNIPRSTKSARTEIVGDGEEVPVEGEGEELAEDQLNMIYNKAQKNDQRMQEMEPAETFTLTLRGYQKQALRWMHSLETGSTTARELTSLHPLWSEYAFPDEPSDHEGSTIDLTADERFFYFNPYSGELSLQFPTAERKYKGGILADEMGMGKTIMLSALIQTNRDPETPDSIADENGTQRAKRRQLKLNNAFRPVANERSQSNRGPSCTLIVAPTSLLSQWSDELERSSRPGTLKAIVWHGQNRLDLEAAIEGEDAVDVVITSYGVLASEHAKYEKSSGQSPIYQTEWLRVILDEAHHCKSRLSKTARAVYALRARRRWAVTGTPIVNKLEDLFSLLKFLGFTPWSDYSFFRSFITLPFLAHDPKAIEIVQVILESILLRREKNMLDTDGKRIVELPAKEVTVEKLNFSHLERKIYDSIYTDAKRNFEDLIARGLVNKNYTHILAMLMRLRRAVLHPSLVRSATSADNPGGDGRVDVNAMIQEFSEGVRDTNDTYAGTVLAGLDEAGDVECPLCLDIMEIPMIIPPCMHKCCKDCINSYLGTCAEKGTEGRCPTCSQGPVKESDLLEVIRTPTVDQEVPDSSTSAARPEVALRKNNFRSSTKLEALLQNLKRLRDQDPCFRAVVFSQFTSFLDLVGSALQREQFVWYRFDGSMNMKKRSEAVADFKVPSGKAKVLIVSLKAGGTGLNLTTANHVFMMDCWWNAAIENQAIDRVHRIGQEKTVYVKHFIVDNTIEGRILQLQKRKTAIVKEAFRGAGEKDTESLDNLKIMFMDD